MTMLAARSIRRTSLSLALWTCALAAVAAAPQAPAPQTPNLSMDGYPAAGAPAIVTVVSTGAAPRVPLRYTIANARKDQLSMNMGMSMQLDMAGTSMPAMQMPGMKVGADLTVTKVSPTGDVSYDLVFTGLNVDTSGVDPALAGMFQGMDADYKNIKGTATITNRGVPVSSALDTSAVTNAQLKQMLDSLSTSLQNLAMPLPEEPIGVGAKWEVRQSMKASGVQSFQKATYEVVAIDGKTVTLKSTTESSAPPQPMSNPALPPGTDVQLQKMSGSGSGTATLHLDGLVPTSDVTAQNSMVMQLSMNGQSQTMATNVTLKISVSPGK